MKRSTILIQVICLMMGVVFITSVAQAQSVRFNDSWSDHGFTLLNTDNGGVDVVHSVNSFNLSGGNINGEIMSMLTMPGVMLPNEAGAPDLPGGARYIAIPQGATA